MKGKFVLFSLITFILVPVFSMPYEDLITPQYAAKLNLGGSVTETQIKNPTLKQLPMHGELRQFVNRIMASLEPNVAVETLFLYEKPKASTQADLSGWSDLQRAELFNQLLSLGTLTGIQYFSTSRGAMRTFYESSVVIDAPDTKRPLPDPKYARPPVSLALYARQKDLTFGDNIYRYDFRTTDDAIFFNQENITALNYGIITAVGKNRLQSVFAVIDCDGFLLIYAVSMAKTATVFGMGDRIGNSFGNRAEAILEWFYGKADGVFAEE